MADLKTVYAALEETAALDALDTFAQHWDKKLPQEMDWQTPGLEFDPRTAARLLL